MQCVSVSAHRHVHVLRIAAPAATHRWHARRCACGCGDACCASRSARSARCARAAHRWHAPCACRLPARTACWFCAATGFVWTAPAAWVCAAQHAPRALSCSFVWTVQLLCGRHADSAAWGCAAPHGRRIALPRGRVCIRRGFAARLVMS
jgi:hypothetical protein